jgi:hypothetical protein
MNPAAPEGPDRGPSAYTPSQRAGLEVRRADQDQTLDAVHRLEAALASAAPRREQAWRDTVTAVLGDLETAMRDEQANAALPESLLSDIARTQPRLRNRVRGLRVAYQQLRDQITALRAELSEDGGDDVDVRDIRQRLGWLLTGVRRQRARESDLIYEAYYEAFHRDLTEDTASGEP